MLIEAQQATPSPPQLGGSQSQMVSSPSPQMGYHMFERLKARVGKYRIHHQMSLQKNQQTIEAQNIKMKHETTRLQQQFLNNSHNTNTSKSKQQKSLNNTNGTARAANKRTNSTANNSNNSNSNNTNSANNGSNTNANSCDANESKPNKLPKLAAGVNSRTTAANNSTVKSSELSPTQTSFRNNNKFNMNSPSNQVDIKMKPTIIPSCISTSTSQPLIPNNSIINSGPEIKREVMDNSYFESVTVDAIRDFLASTNTSSGPNGVEGLNSDIWKDFFNDGPLADDGLESANFGDEDFITKFLEEINETAYDNGLNFQQPSIHNNNIQIKQVISQSNANTVTNNLINNSINQNTGNNTNPSNNMNVNNSLNFNRNQFQNANNDMTSYTPIQPRLQPNSIANIPNRPNVQTINTNANFIPNVITVNNNRNFAPNSMQQQQQPQGLLVQQTSLLPQQSLNNVQLQQQSQPSHLILQQQPSQPVHLRLTSDGIQRMGSVVSVMPKTENNLSVQLSIQVPQQQQISQHQTPQQVPQQSTQSSQSSANASIKLKQMAQQVQQKTHQWVINHSNIPLTQNNIQSQQEIQQQKQSHQRITQQIVVQQRPTPSIGQQQQQQQQQQNQSIQIPQQYFTQQVAQQVYWQPQQGQQQTQIQQQSQPQQGLQQNQQQFQNYWSHQVMPQQNQIPHNSQQTQQQTQQQPQHYFNNSYNYF